MAKQRTVLKNDTLIVEIDETGAELKRIAHAHANIEYLWGADPAYWGRSAPILFPIVGRLKGDRYFFAGTSYDMPQHGFARNVPFTLKRADTHRALFELDATEEQQPKYPFCFLLEVAFELLPSAVCISYAVSNRDNQAMYFSIGSHPAFNIPLVNGKTSDYYVEFEKREEDVCYRIEAGLQSAPMPSLLSGGTILPLGDNLFAADAIVFKNVQSKKISIRNTIDNHSVVVDTGGAPYLGIWSKPGAPFVCIEPWFGIADKPDADGDLTKKEGIRELAPGEVFRANYAILVS